jgi:hypothetical protein
MVHYTELDFPEWPDLDLGSLTRETLSKLHRLPGSSTDSDYAATQATELTSLARNSIFDGWLTPSAFA